MPNSRWPSDPAKRFRCIDPADQQPRPYLQVLRGLYFSGKNDRQMPFIGRLHHDFMVRLEAEPDVVSYQHPSQPVTWSGGRHPFRFSYKTRVGGSVLADVQWRKTIDDNDLTAFKPELDAAAHASGHARFEIWSDAEIHDADAFERAQQIAPFTAETRIDPEQLTALLAEARAKGAMSIADLAATSASDKARGLILGAIARGVLALVDPAQRVTPYSLVRVGSDGR